MYRSLISVKYKRVGILTTCVGASLTDFCLATADGYSEAERDRIMSTVGTITLRAYRVKSIRDVLRSSEGRKYSDPGPSWASSNSTDAFPEFAVKSQRLETQVR